MKYYSPEAVLGVSHYATEAQIRARYVELVKLHSPDRDPDTFERVRDAYRQMSDPRWRARALVLGPEPFEDLEQLEAALRTRGRQPIGADAWLSLLRAEHS